MPIRNLLMRFHLEFLNMQNTAANPGSISLLSSLLNYHLIGKHHGWTYECIFITFVANAPREKKWKIGRTYENWAKVEVPFDFNSPYRMEEPRYVLAQIKHAVELVPTIKGVKNLDFRQQDLLADLTQLEKMLPTSLEEYYQLAEQTLHMDRQFQLRRVNGLMQAYKAYPQPHTRQLAGVRIYDRFETETLMPYRYMYAEIFGTLLRNARISTPGYREIYFSVAETLEEAKQEIASKDWYKYTYASIDLAVYQKASEEQKEKMLLDALIEGLHLIADFDHLDKQKIEAVISEVSATKTKTPLTYGFKENDRHRVSIHYAVDPDHTKKTPFYIRMTNKVTGRETTQRIDNFDLLWAAYSFGKIRLTETTFEIRGGGGERGAVSRQRDHLPDRYIFELP